MSLNPLQIDQLLRPIHHSRVQTLSARRYVEASEIRAMLNRTFGFGGWSLINIDPPVLLHEVPTETKQGKPAFKVAYRASMRLTIHETGAVYDGTAVGESTMPDFKYGDCHDMALKTAESGAFKRAAVNLGDQFGLSLYRENWHEPLVRKSWNGDDFSNSGPTA